jgi:hypothetical protein
MQRLNMRISYCVPETVAQCYERRLRCVLLADSKIDHYLLYDIENADPTCLWDIHMVEGMMNVTDARLAFHDQLVLVTSMNGYVALVGLVSRHVYKTFHLPNKAIITALMLPNQVTVILTRNEIRFQVNPHEKEQWKTSNAPMTSVYFDEQQDLLLVTLEDRIQVYSIEYWNSSTTAKEQKMHFTHPLVHLVAFAPVYGCVGLYYVIDRKYGVYNLNLNNMNLQWKAEQSFGSVAITSGPVPGRCYGGTLARSRAGTQSNNPNKHLPADGKWWLDYKAYPNITISKIRRRARHLNRPLNRPLNRSKPPIKNYFPTLVILEESANNGRWLTELVSSKFITFYDFVSVHYVLPPMTFDMLG